MSSCAKCGKSKESLKSLTPKYIDLGGTLTQPKGRKVCSVCRIEIRDWIKAQVFCFNSLFHPLVMSPF
jgi:hypothetical protein